MDRGAGVRVAKSCFDQLMPGEADLLFAGHRHAFRMPDLGWGRTLVACSAMDGGSARFTNRRGVSSHVGMVSVEITSDAPYWRAPVPHTA